MHYYDLVAKVLFMGEALGFRGRKFKERAQMISQYERDEGGGSVKNGRRSDAAKRGTCFESGAFVSSIPV